LPKSYNMARTKKSITGEELLDNLSEAVTMGSEHMRNIRNMREKWGVLKRSDIAPIFSAQKRANKLMCEFIAFLHLNAEEREKYCKHTKAKKTLEFGDASDTDPAVEVDGESSEEMESPLATPVGVEDEGQNEPDDCSASQEQI
jgi:hypothetical protein